MYLISHAIYGPVPREALFEALPNFVCPVCPAPREKFTSRVAGHGELSETNLQHRLTAALLKRGVLLGQNTSTEMVQNTQFKGIGHKF